MTISAILLTSVLLQAQSVTPPAPDQVRALLASSDAKDQSWGAWWTSETRLNSVEPLLRKNLEAHVRGTDWQDASVVDATLDAYIQSNSNPPPVELLEAVYARRPTPALIMLSRVKPTEQADAFLLKQVHEEANRGESYEWFFAANLLLMHRTPGFVAAVLRDLRIKANVTLCDSGPGCSMRGGGRMWQDGGFGGGATPGFPPSASYTVMFANAATRPADTVLVSGPTPVMYSRKVSPAHVPAPANGRMPGSVDPPRPFTSDRFKYVAAALDVKNGVSGSRLAIQDDDSRVIQWSTQPAFAADIQRIREDIRKRYTDVIQQLRSSSLLSVEEAAELAIPQIHIDLTDLRSVTTPLGDLSNR